MYSRKDNSPRSALGPCESFPFDARYGVETSQFSMGVPPGSRPSFVRLGF